MSTGDYLFPCFALVPGCLSCYVKFLTKKTGLPPRSRMAPRRHFSRLGQIGSCASRSVDGDEAALREGTKAPFFRAAGHDLRQPLQTLAILVELLRRHAPNDPALRSLVERQETALWSMRAMLDGFLDACRLDAGALAVSMRPVALESLLDGLYEDLHEQAGKRAMRLRLGPRRMQVLADSGLLLRALTMVLMHIMAIGGARQVLIGCRRRGRGVRVELWCAGSTLDANRLAAALRDPDVPDGAWPGLALTVARRCAESLASVFEVRSVGGSTMFALMLPSVAGAEAPDRA